MTAEVFLDTNIFLYACSSAPDDGAKQARAAALILDQRIAFSAQVLQEFIADVLGKKTLGISEAGIDAFMELSGHVPVLPVTRELVLSAVILRRRFQLSHRDATILAAAQELGCHTLYSEDFQHGQDYDGLKIVNPFR